MDTHFFSVRLVRCVLRIRTAPSSSLEPSEGEWDLIRAVIFKALRPFEEARVAVREALATLGQAPA